MKKINYILKTMAQVTFVASIFFLISCETKQNNQGSREAAENRNDERFDEKDQENDAKFLVNAAEINLGEIQYGQLAQQKGNSPAVKELGKMMEDTHTKSQSELMRLAKVKNISIPNSPTEDTKDNYTTLNKKSGEDFDKSYTDKLVSRHEDAIDKFEDASTDSNDNDIKNYAIETLPNLRKHLNHSKECQDKLDNRQSSRKK